MSDPSPWYLFNLRCMSHGFYEEIRVSETFMSVDGLLDVVFKFTFCFHAGQDCILLTRFAKNILDLQLCSSILGALCARMLDSTRCFHVCTAMHGLSLKCSTRGFQSYRGLISFCTGLGDAIFLKLEGNIMSDPSPWYLFNLRCMSHGFYDEIRVSETFMSNGGPLDVVFKFIFCFHSGQDCILLTRFAKNILDLQLCSSILGALCARMLDSTRCFHVCTAMHGLSLKCSTRGFQSYRGLIWFCTGLGGTIFLKLEGNIMSDPSPWYLFNLRCMSHGFYEEIRVSETFMSVDGLLDVVFKFIFCFHAGQDCILLTRFAKNILDLQLCSSILGALCARMLDSTRCFHVRTAMHGLSLKCSTREFQSYRGLIWFCTGLGGAIFLKLEGNIMSDPSPWYLFNLRCMPHGFYEEIRVSETFMSVDGLLDVVFKFTFCFHAGQDCILLARFAKNMLDHQLCSSILGAL